MKWTLGLGAAAAGFVGAAVVMVALYVYTPGRPGRHELLLELTMVGFIAGTLGVIGFGIGCVIDLCAGMRRKLQRRR